MRRPTPDSELYQWHRSRVAAAGLGDLIAPFVNEPQCGWFKRTLVKGGPFVPARIWIEREIDPETGELASDEVLCCEVNGERRDPEAEWLWLYEHAITESEFRYMTALRYHAAWHEPDAPEANPKKPIDWLRAKSPFAR